MGPKDAQPPFPDIEYAALPDDHVYASRWLQRTNWSQGLEGEIDSSHISWLHRDFDKETTKQKGVGSQMTADGAPHIEIRETKYGMVYGARREHEGQFQWRVTQFFLPMFSLIPRAPGEFVSGGGRAWVPIDDNHTAVFSFGYRVDHKIEEDELDSYYRSGQLFPPRRTREAYKLPDDTIIDIWVPIASKENDYELSREMQRTVNYSGIWGVHDQDRALAENSRPVAGNPGIADRSHEHLVSSDRAVVAARRILINMADRLASGDEPEVVQEPELFRVRAISKMCDIDNFDEFIEVYADEFVAASVPERDSVGGAR